MSLAAMKQLEGNLEFKRTASTIAAGVVDPGKILEIRMSDGPDEDLKVEVVRRRS